MCDSGVTDDPDDPTGEGETYDWFADEDKRLHTGPYPAVFTEPLPPPGNAAGMYGGAIKDAIERNAAAEREAQIDRELEERDNVGAKDPSVYGYSSDIQQWVDQITAEKEAKDKALQDAADAYETEWEMGTDAYASRQFYNPELRDQRPVPQNSVPAGTDYGFGYNPKDFNQSKPTGASGGGGDDDGGFINTILGIPRAIGGFFTKNPVGQAITNAGLQAAAFGLGGPGGTIALNAGLTNVDKDDPDFGFVGKNIGEAAANMIGAGLPINAPLAKGLATGFLEKGLSTPNNKGLPDIPGNMEKLASDARNMNWTPQAKALGSYFNNLISGKAEVGAGKPEPGRNLNTIEWTPKSAENTFGLGDLTGRYTGMTRKKKQ